METITKVVSNNSIVYSHSNDRKLLAFLFIVIIFFGTRPVSWAFGDMVRYDWQYEEIVYYLNRGEIKEVFAKPTEVVLQVIAYLSSFFSKDSSLFFFVFTLGYIFLPYWALKKMDVKCTYMCMLSFMSTISFFNMCTNVIRNGLAASITILAFAFLLSDKKSKLGFLLCAVAVLTHTSMLLPIVIFIFLQHYDITLKRSLIIWVCCIGVSLVIGNKLANILNELDFVADRFEGYVVEESTRYKIGFRWDFLLYSAIPIVSSLYLCRKYNVEDAKFFQLLKTYILANAFWILVIRMQFTDRMAYLSWFLYAIILFVPVTLLPTERLRNFWGGLLIGVGISIRLALFMMKG